MVILGVVVIMPGHMVTQTKTPMVGDFPNHNTTITVVDRNFLTVVGVIPKLLSFRAKGRAVDIQDLRTRRRADRIAVTTCFHKNFMKFLSFMFLVMWLPSKVVSVWDDETNYESLYKDLIHEG